MFKKLVALSVLFYFNSQHNSFCQTEVNPGVNPRIQEYMATANIILWKYANSEDSIKRGIRLIDQAIRIDNKLTKLHWIKCQLESGLGHFDTALTEFDLGAMPYDEGYMVSEIRGMLLWKIGKRDSANLLFKTAFKEFIKTSSDTSGFNDIQAKAMLYLLTDEIEKSRAEWAYIRKTHADDPVFRGNDGNKDIFFNFNKDKLINSIIRKTTK